MEYHIISTLYTEENDTPITWAPSPLIGVDIVSSQTTHPSHGHPCPTGEHTSIHPYHGHPHPIEGHTMFCISLIMERHTHLMGTPNSWALSQADSLSFCPGGCLTKL
jgi:hypothetical protein